MSEDPLEVYEARCVGCRVDIASPRALAPAFRIAVARIAAAGVVFAFEDEVDRGGCCLDAKAERKRGLGRRAARRS